MSQTSPPPPPTGSSLASAARPMGSGGTLLVFLVAGLLAGGASLTLVTVLKDFFKIPEEFANISTNDEKGQARLAAAQAEVATKNLLLTVGLLGAVVAGVMGLAGGVRDRSFGRGVVGLLLGLVLGGGLGVASAYLGPESVGPRFNAMIPRTAAFETAQDWKMYSTLAVHATIWGMIGVAAALAATIPARWIRPMLNSAVGALVAAGLAMLIYQALLGNLFQVSRFEVFLPKDWGPMIAWTLPTGVLIGVAIGRLSVPRQTKAA